MSQETQKIQTQAQFGNALWEVYQTTHPYEPLNLIKVARDLSGDLTVESWGGLRRRSIMTPRELSRLLRNDSPEINLPAHIDRLLPRIQKTWQVPEDRMQVLVNAYLHDWKAKFISSNSNT